MTPNRATKEVKPSPLETALNDYKIAFISRQASLLGRKEVLNGRAKFGIFGDGKEVAQVALAHYFHKGDWRSGYYRDQTLLFALGTLSVRNFFAQLFADTSTIREPASAGRQMNCHFASRLLDENGFWKSQLDQYNSSSDISPTGGQMARLLGLAYASKLYRENPRLQTTDADLFSSKGNEVAFGMIGNASTSEGIFWETINAAAVLKVPMAISIWDDGYGISVPNEFQTAKSSISKALAGFDANGEDPTSALKIYKASGEDYSECMQTYQKATEFCRKQHIPCLIHVVNMTQPQGHSTSGSHERYKSEARLDYEKSIDCLQKMRTWILSMSIAKESELDSLESEAIEFVEKEKSIAWTEYQEPIRNTRNKIKEQLVNFKNQENMGNLLDPCIASITDKDFVLLKDAHIDCSNALFALRSQKFATKHPIIDIYKDLRNKMNEKFSSHLYAETKLSEGSETILPETEDHAKSVDGRQVIQKYFDKKIESDPRIFILGEDIGKLGGVNLEFEGLNEKYGSLHVGDTGIREASILGQGIGAALRGLRPVIDIQYLDYLLYCLQPLSDDLATLHYRTAGGQIAPVIIRTKGHRLEGIWHTGSPIGMLLGSVRGVHLCVPRNAVQACGMYETLLSEQNPGIVIEVLNGYRLKEPLPNNLGKYKIPLGVPDFLLLGKDITVVTYGANVPIAMEAAKYLKTLNIELEIIDVQTLLPFDKNNSIAGSLQKTNAVIFFDEDTPGGASAFMLQQVLEAQKGYDFLDSPPRTLSAKEHRSAYGSDGDYFSKPNKEDLVFLACEIMHERYPQKFPSILPPQ